MNCKRDIGENEEQYIWRLGQAKDNGLIDLDWNEIADLINHEFREDESEYRSESAYRKSYNQARRFLDAGVFQSLAGDGYVDELTAAKHEIRKEKQKLFDERTALNKMLREQGRMESMFDVVKHAIDEFVPARFDYSRSYTEDSENDVVIHLTDIHCGVEIESPLNTFNVNVLKSRLIKYLNEIERIQKTYNAQDAYVILGGDLLHGIIHVNARIEAKENVVRQIMIVSDLISDFLYELCKIFASVEVHTTSGNHSRAMASKDEAVRGENFDLLIPYICEKELQRVDNITFAENYLESDIATFSVRGHMVYATHGDKDTPKNVVYHMTQFARKTGLDLPDICYLGHRHNNGLTTVDGVKVIESGCVDGMDSYAIDKRLVNAAEQTVTVISEDHRIKALCDIQID